MLAAPPRPRPPAPPAPTRRRALIAAWATLALTAAGAGCGGSAGARRGPPSYPERVAARVLAASELRVFQVRHNPTPCACPPWEVLLGGHWQRAQLVGDGGELDPVAVLRDQAESGAALRWVVQGELDDDVSSCGRGAQVVELRVLALGRPETPPGEPADPTSPPPAAGPSEGSP